MHKRFVVINITKCFCWPSNDEFTRLAIVRQGSIRLDNTGMGAWKEAPSTLAQDLGDKTKKGRSTYCLEDLFAAFLISWTSSMSSQSNLR